jgi:hypothetical protein
MRKERKEERTVSFFAGDLEWLDRQAARRKAGRSALLAEMIAAARGEAVEDDALKMVVERLGRVEAMVKSLAGIAVGLDRHARRTRAMVSLDQQVAILGEAARPRTLEQLKLRTEQLEEGYIREI